MTAVMRSTLPATFWAKVIKTESSPSAGSGTSSVGEAVPTLFSGERGGER